VPPEIAASRAQPIAPIDLASLALIAVVWGVNNLLAKIAVDALPPLLAAGLRFAVVLVVLAPLLRPPKGGLAMLALVAVLTGFVHQGIQYAGLAMAHDLAPMVIAMQLWIPASVGFAALWLGERAGPWRLAGIGAAFAGIVAMAVDPVVFRQLPALALVAGAAAIYGAAAVLVRRSPPLNPLTYQAWIALFATPGLLGASALFETGQMEAVRTAPWGIWAAILFAGLASSVAANALMFQLVQRYEVSRTTPFLFISPVIGVALGVIVLGDPLTWQFLLGAVLTLAGVALVAMAERRAG
jgi:O-acetylserine/cysteine efflux transporter